MDKSYTPGELVNIAEAWAEVKETRSIVILAIERDDDANKADDSNRKFKNPQTGRVYSTEGLAPCLTCMEGGKGSQK